jgi:serine/threonine protein kinase
VYLVQHVATGLLYAMKVMQKVYRTKLRKSEKRKLKQKLLESAVTATVTTGDGNSLDGSPAITPPEGSQESLSGTQTPSPQKMKIYFDGQKERDILASINQHPFLVTLRFAFQDERHLYLVLDWAEGGELWYYVAKEGLCLEDTASFYIAQIVLALEHVHSLGILYRDLKVCCILREACT